MNHNNLGWAWACLQEEHTTTVYDGERFNVPMIIPVSLTVSRDLQ